MIVAPKCSRHPRYGAKRAPRGDCFKCWFIWNLSKAKHLTSSKEPPSFFEQWEKVIKDTRR